MLTSPLRASVVSDAGSDTSEHCEPVFYPQTKTWKDNVCKQLNITRRSAKVFIVFLDVRTAINVNSLTEVWLWSGPAA